MESLDGTTDVVHPEVRAHINSLVSALGGTSTDEDGRYVLGDDALEVLKDLRKWIRFYDEKTNRMDVARCLSEAHLVDGDLLQILALWPESEADNNFKARIALACYEAIVPLTWPIEKDFENMTVNHHRHIPTLELAQLGYKRAIINFDGAQILHTAIRVALPSIAIPHKERSIRDQGIIKLVLFFLRNIAMITTPPDVDYSGDESQVSRSATIDAFSYQDVFLFLLTLSSNMADDFKSEDTIVMETIFHLVKRVDVEKMFMTEKELMKAKTDELSTLMKKEDNMLKAHNRKGPTRHSRFGTMVWVKREGTKMSSLSGQDALADAATRQKKMDDSKVYRPPRYRRKNRVENRDLGPAPKLNARANDQLKSFVEEFLDSGFNPLFQSIRKSIDREESHVLHYHPRQFFYLVAWFLHAERIRRKAKPNPTSTMPIEGEVSSFNLVAGVLNQEMFITLHRALQTAYDNKSWEDLIAAMRCLTQILITVQEMTTTNNEEDEEIADNILSRLFYENTLHDLVLHVVRNYNHQGFDFLDAATDLTHHFLRLLEAYSKQNVDMQVRSRRRARKRKKALKEKQNDEEDEGDHSDGSGNDEAVAEKAMGERKFDFQKFSHKFTPQGVVDTFTLFLKYYRDLDDEQLKRVHRYFYRLSFKHELSVMLFRADIIHLLHSMIKGPEPLDKGSSMYKDWEELIKQILKKCIRKIEERPQLLVEMLFSKTDGIAFFLEHGHPKQTISTVPRPAAELEFRHTEGLDKQIAIVVGALLDKGHADQISWLKTVLQSAEDERRSWAAAEVALASTTLTAPALEPVSGDGDLDSLMREEGDSVVPSIEPADGGSAAQEAANAPQPPVFIIKPENETRRRVMMKNGHLRLLMKLTGVRRRDENVEETLESIWVIPPEITAEQLKECLDHIKTAEFSPPVFEEGVLAEHQLRRKPAARRPRPDHEPESEEENLEMLFPAGGPTTRHAIDEPERPKKSRKLRRRRSQSPDDAELAERARKRRQKEREKARKIKSDMYVHASDDESDEERDREFFARELEQKLRNQRAAEAVGQAIPGLISLAKTKRKSEAVQLSDSDEASDTNDDPVSISSQSSTMVGDEDSEMDDVPISSRSSQTNKRRRLQEPEREEETGDDDMLDGDEDKENSASLQKIIGSTEPSHKQVEDEEDEDEEPVPSVKMRPRRRMVAGFVMDSDDE